MGKKLSKSDEGKPENGKWLDMLWEVRHTENRLEATRFMCKNLTPECIAAIAKAEATLTDARNRFRKLDESY